MSWVKLDDQFFHHPKVIDLSKDAKLLHLAALTHCAGQLTDGLITAGALRSIAALVDVDCNAVTNMLQGVTCNAVTELLLAGLWQKEGSGYRIHNYLKYQPSAAQEKARRQAGSERVAAWRDRNKSSNAVSNAVTSGVGNAVSTLSPSPSPSPITLSELTSLSGEVNLSDAAAVSSEQPAAAAAAIKRPSVNTERKDRGIRIREALKLKLEDAPAIDAILREYDNQGAWVEHQAHAYAAWTREPNPDGTRRPKASFTAYSRWIAREAQRDQTALVAASKRTSGGALDGQQSTNDKAHRQRREPTAEELASDQQRRAERRAYLTGRAVATDVV